MKIKKTFEKLSASFDIVKTIAKLEYKYLFYALPQIICSAALPVLYVYFPKLIIEKILERDSYYVVLKTITLYVIVLIILNVLSVFLKNKSGLFIEEFPKKLRQKIGAATMNTQLKNVESAEFRDLIHLSGKSEELTEIIDSLGEIVSKIITIISLAYIIIQLDYIFILLVAVVLAVKVFFVYNNFCFRKQYRVREAKNTRNGNYLYKLRNSEGGAKEIRLNNLKNWYTQKVKDFRNDMLDIQYKSMYRYAFYNIGTAILTAVQSLIVLWLLTGRYVQNTISLADFTMYFSAVVSITASLSAITEQIGKYNQQILNAADYKKLTSIDNNIVIDQNTFSGMDVSSGVEFVFRNVSFAYPNTGIKVLDNINITIKNREKLVIVGENGSGKTTFVKLLCKFYQPDNGVITLNGVDIWSIPNEEYYKIISAVFQDFVNFAFSIREVISMSESWDEEENEIRKVIENVGMKEYIENFPEGYDTYISKKFHSKGVEFSGGYGQKAAIARAIYKNTPLLILDEPTASLDPRAESEIYENFFNMSRDKTTIFISHRLAAATIADNIALFSNGGIAEYGPHDELIKKGGVYAEMYTKQSLSYIDERKIF